MHFDLTDDPHTNYNQMPEVAHLTPLQEAYRANRSTEDTISTILHLVLSHLKRITCVRVIFIGLGSAFNTVAEAARCGHCNLQQDTHQGGHTPTPFTSRMCSDPTVYPSPTVILQNEGGAYHTTAT